MRAFLATTILLLVLSMLPWGAYAGAHGALWRELAAHSDGTLQSKAGAGSPHAAATPEPVDRAATVVRQAERPCRTATVPGSACGLQPWLAAEAETAPARDGPGLLLRPERGRFGAGRNPTAPTGPPRQA